MIHELQLAPWKHKGEHVAGCTCGWRGKHIWAGMRGVGWEFDQHVAEAELGRVRGSAEPRRPRADDRHLDPVP